MYLVQETAIVYRVAIDLEWDVKSAADTPKPKPKVVSAGSAASLDEEHRGKLREQFPKVNYLP